MVVTIRSVCFVTHTLYIYRREDPIKFSCLFWRDLESLSRFSVCLLLSNDNSQGAPHKYGPVGFATNYYGNRRPHGYPYGGYNQRPPFGDYYPGSYGDGYGHRNEFESLRPYGYDAEPGDYEIYGRSLGKNRTQTNGKPEAEEANEAIEKQWRLQIGYILDALGIHFSRSSSQVIAWFFNLSMEMPKTRCNSRLHKDSDTPFEFRNGLKLRDDFVRPEDKLGNERIVSRF